MITNLNSEPLLIQAVFSGNVDEVKSLINQKSDVNSQSLHSRITALHAAAHCGYSEIAEILCNAGARVNAKDARCLTALHYACRSKSEETVKVLLKNNADVNARDKSWQAALHVCATHNSVNCAKQIIPLMQNIDVTDRQGRSALAHAAFTGNLQMIELLLENGANCNVHDKQERKPIHWASFVGYSNIIEVLKRHGADINCLDKEHYTPLLVACASGKSEETIQLLIELGSNLYAKTIHDSTAYHLACLNGHDLIVKELLAHEIAMSANAKGYHPIHYAAVSKRGAFCLELLINLGIDVNIQSKDGKTPLHITAIHGCFSCAQILIHNGAHINVQDSENNTPLHLAALSGNELMISILLEYRASIDIRGANGMLPFAMAALHGHSNCFKDLESILETNETRREYFETRDDFQRTFLHLAAISGNVDCIDLFINSGCDVNAKDRYGNTPLHYACSGPYMQCILSLLIAGADLDIDNSHGCTALMYACAFDPEGRAVRTLLNARANAAITDKFGYNAMHYAAIHGNKNVFELLADRCKNMNHQENEKLLSPLHILAFHGHKEALDVLASSFTNLDVQDINGRTPLDLACYRGSTGCVESLILNGANCVLRDNINQRTALHAAAYNNNEDCIKIMFLLCNDRKELINVRDKFQRTPLMIAVEQGHLNTISYLISQQADLDAIDDKGCTSLHRSAALGYEECCISLLKNNASPLIRDSNGLLPIHYVVIAGHANLISLFSEFKYENLLDNQGFSLLHFACFNGHSTCAETLCEISMVSDAFEWLLEPFNKFTPLHCACFNGHDACVNFLLQKFGSKIIELQDKQGRRAIHICALNNELECAQLLLENNCELNALTSNNDTPLLLAAANNSIEMLELLIDEDVKLNQVNGDINNIMHMALLNGHEAAALLILEKINEPAIFNQTNADGMTPLHLAASNGFSSCVDILLSKGASIWVKNNKAQTPILSCAKNDKVAECLELMLTKLMQSMNSIDSTFSSSAVINRDVHLNTGNISSNTESHPITHANELNTTCTLNTFGNTTTSLNESLKDNTSIQSSDSEFY